MEPQRAIYSLKLMFVVTLMTAIITKAAPSPSSPRQLRAIIIQKAPVLLLAQTLKQLRKRVTRLLNTQVSVRPAHVSFHPSCTTRHQQPSTLQHTRLTMPLAY